jgi:putative DNA primase/helicase
VAVYAFLEAMSQGGLVTHDDILPDGELHRFHIEGDRRGSRNGWYVLHLDGVPAGAFGSWKIGETHVWCAKDKRNFTEAERSEYQRRIEDARQLRNLDRKFEADRAREKAQGIWQSSQPVEIHPYLNTKRVKAFGIRQYRGCLVIPLRDTQGVIHSLQFIGAGGNKRFLFGGAITSYYHPIGPYQDTLCVSEGYATGATLHQATGHAVAVAFNAGNLRAVAVVLRGKFPEARIIICADNDRFTPGNPGVTKAREAALAVHGRLYVPRFEDLGPYDFYRKGSHHE